MLRVSFIITPLRLASNVNLVCYRNILELIPQFILQYMYIHLFTLSITNNCVALHISCVIVILI